MASIYDKFRVRLRLSRFIDISCGPISLMITFLSRRISICSWKSLIPSATTNLFTLEWISKRCFMSLNMISCFVNSACLSASTCNWFGSTSAKLSGATLCESDWVFSISLFWVCHSLLRGSKFALNLPSPKFRLMSAWHRAPYCIACLFCLIILS